MIGQTRVERADAARNRRKILDAADRLIAERGVETLSMEDVASAAGVGVGTLYRRFGDRTGLAYALMDERERAFQAGFLAGPPPLGPGAPAAERIEAFLHACVDDVGVNPHLRQMAEAPQGSRFTSAAHGVRHTHLTVLLRAACPDADAEYLADALLAPLAADLYLHHRSRGVDADRIKAGLSRIVRGLTGPPGPER